MTEILKIVALAHSKHRNAIGLVGIEVDPVKQEITLRLAKQWPRKKINDIAPQVAELYKKHQWFNTVIDFQVGDHVIQGLRRAGGMPIKIIHIQKKVKDHLEIERVKTMDIIEQTQFMLQMKLAHKIIFPKTPTPAMSQLEAQVALFSEHKTESGSIDYYAPGDEFDNLTKALIIACFAARPYMQASTKIIGGPLIRRGKPEEGFPISIDITSRGFKRKF